MTRRMREPFHTLMWKASIGYNDSWRQVDPEVLEKFAELIVKECANTAYQSLYEDKVFDNSPHNIRCNVMDAIKKHFGVEK
jgi:hypothetical protein